MERAWQRWVVVGLLGFLLAWPQVLRAQQLYDDNCDLAQQGDAIATQLSTQAAQNIASNLRDALSSFNLSCLTNIPFSMGGFGTLQGLIGGLIGGALRDFLGRIQRGICGAIRASVEPTERQELSERLAIVLLRREYIA